MNTLPIARHLALYTTFHQDHRNRLVHHLASPFVYFSALLAVQVVAPALVPFIFVGSIVMLALADWKGALAVGVQYGLEWAAAAWVAHHLGAVPALLVAGVVQGSAWAALIFIGHMKYEPHLSVDGAPASKGLYFERKYNRGEGLGVSLTFFDRVLQFSIAPLAHANEMLFAVGLRRDLEAEIALERVQVIARLDAGLTPFDAVTAPARAAAARVPAAA